MDELRKLAMAATPGPWKATPFDFGMHGVVSCNSDVIGEAEEADAAFIAGASPTVVLGLLDRITELEARVCEGGDLSQSVRQEGGEVMKNEA